MRTWFYHTNIHTFDEEMPHAEAMLVEGGKIVAIGRYEDMRSHLSSSDLKVDLKGKVVMPGFNDAHIHLWKVGDLKTGIADLRGVKSLEEMFVHLFDFLKNNPHKSWLVARGFNQATLAEKRMPTKTDLDRAFPDIPVCLVRTCAHIIVVNSKALEIAGVDERTPVPLGGEIGVDEYGKLNGIFSETAMGLIKRHLPVYEATDYTRMVEVASQELLSLGVTSATDPAVAPDLLEVYHHLQTTNQLSIRINAIPISIPDGEEQALPLPQKFDSDFLVVDTIKFFADGGLSGATAALHRPYKHQPQGFGVLRLSYDQFYPIALRAREKGWRIATHAIGDRALDEVLRVYEAIQSEIASPIRNRIEHLGIASREQLSRIKRLHIGVETQPIFLRELGQNFKNCIDEVYLERCYAFKDMLEEGITLGFSTDAPVVKEMNPLVGIQAAIDRKDNQGNAIAASQSIDLYTGLRAYTLGSAEVQQEAHKKGTLSLGKYADFICLDRELTSASDLSAAKVLQTYVGGVLRYEAV